MNHIGTALDWAGIIAVIAVVALPLVAIVLVSLASVREESAHSLSGQPPGWAERMARRLLGYRTDPAAVNQAQRTAARNRTEVRFAHARRTMPGPGQQRASGESGARADSAWRRQGAGV